MKHGLMIAVGICLVLLVLFVLLKRRRKKRGVQGSLKHPQGFIKYHPHTKVQIKSALGGARDSAPLPAAIICFKGDLQATQRVGLSHFVDEIILNRARLSEVIVKIESPGGSVTDYGHAYGEIARLREADLTVVACVDTVAASGGYLMCLPANRILAAPFSMIGSIGVVSFVPNIRRLLERFDIVPRTFTAGDYKRTVSFTDDATPDQVERYKLQLELIHDQFKQALTRYRPQVDLARVATGEAWLASTSMEKNLGLIDGLRLSSDYLLALNADRDLIEFSERNEVRGWRALLKRWMRLAQNLAIKSATLSAE